jgi:hypothetical protein
MKRLRKAALLTPLAVVVLRLVERGNWFGTAAYFPFYRAVISHAEFL